MKTIDVAKYSLKSLRHREIRSWLTILGIVIGIAAVVALLTMGEGFNLEVERELSELGGSTVFISPIAESSGTSFGPPTGPTSGKLYDKDAERLKRIPDILDVARLAMGRASVAFKDKEITSTISGIEPGVFEKTTSITMSGGRFLLDSDRHVAVIGAGIAEDTFGPNKNVQVNSYLFIDGAKYRVVGIIERTGGGFGPAARLDSGIFIHFDDLRQAFAETLAEDEIGAMAIRVREGTDMAEVAEKIKLELDASHRVRPSERDYSVVTPDSIKDSINSILSMITLFLGAIAGISLIVGALAIASGMFTSVIERTHEIGVLKSIGANERDILNIFLFESGALGGIGGIFGSGLGLTIVQAGALFGLPAHVNPAIALFGVAFAFAIGLVSGYLPAKSAAELSPVETLRYE